jgi:hypothetical protein
MTGTLIGYSAGWVKADASAGIEAFYIVGQAGVAGDVVTVYRSVNLIDWDEPFTPGSKIWVSPSTPGGWTHTQPTTLGDMIQFLGVASSTSKAALHCGMGVGVGGMGGTGDPSVLADPKLGFAFAGSATPRLNWDTNDRQYYDRTGNRWGWQIGGIDTMILYGDRLQLLAAIFQEMQARAKPSAPASGMGRFYGKTVSGQVCPFWLDASDTEYNLLDSQASNGVITADLAHSGAHAGFFGTTPIVQPDAYTPSNVTPDRSFDANATSIDEIADVLGTLIADLKAYGLLK